MLRCRGGARPERIAQSAQISIDTSKAAVARAAARGRREPRQRRQRLPRRPGDGCGRGGRGGVECCLMHMLGEPRTMQRGPALRGRRRRGRGVPRGASGVRRRARACARSGSCSTPASASARPSRTTSSCCAGWTSSSRWARPSSSAPRARASSGASSPRASASRRAGRCRRSGSLGTIATNVLAFERGASVFRVHDVAPVRDALAVAAATLGRDGR